MAERRDIVIDNMDTFGRWWQLDGYRTDREAIRRAKRLTGVSRVKVDGVVVWTSPGYVPDIRIDSKDKEVGPWQLGAESYGSVAEASHHAERLPGLHRVKADGVVVWSSQHVSDDDCTVGEDGCCTVCGVTHQIECDACGGRGFHKSDCSDQEVL